MASTQGRLLSVNVGHVRKFEYEGQLGTSSIWKSPVAGRVAVRGVNIVGDDQADRSVHGGPDKAIYSYAIELEIRWPSGRTETLYGVAANQRLRVVEPGRSAVSEPLAGQ